MVIDPEHGTIDSPMHPSQVQLAVGAREAVTQLRAWGFKLAVCTNQPSAAKGKTTRANLEAVHARVLELLGAPFESSNICWHRSEDGCACRKPAPGMLLNALRETGVAASSAWMVGDGVTDVQAGRAAGVRTAFLGAKRCDICTTLAKIDVRPDMHVADLTEFVREFARLNGL